MLSEQAITRENLNGYLKELAKDFRKLNGSKMPAEVILIGGAAVLANYGFREMTYDIDAIILASSAMKEAINSVGDRHGLPNGWFNADFKHTGSYSDRLYEVSVYYKTFSNILTVRTVAAEYLIAMKLMSGRQYKNDLSDIAGILLEHERRGEPISRERIETALTKLYGEAKVLPETSEELLNTAFERGDYEKLYRESRESERLSKEVLLKFEQDYPDALKSENIDSIIKRAKSKQAAAPQKPSILAELEDSIAQSNNETRSSHKRKTKNEQEV
ncbi:hypothetical protein FACS1894219_02350 [Clostridia bacterium]|nr:hypothetical protein FACS1894219_02350 [Clostridia bacterium]